jgi:hypothetical protein
MENRKCEKCYSIKELSLFRKYNNTSFSTTCKKCLNEMDKLRKIRVRKNYLETTLATCERCNNEKCMKSI